jgi:hypothetical protein
MVGGVDARCADREEEDAKKGYLDTKRKKNERKQLEFPLIL